jgi:tetratricopeptide (TPR) repeat protein
MGIRDFFKKEVRPDEGVRKVFDKIDAVLTAKQMVNTAISHRNLGQHDKAISLLKEVIREYPVYAPAKTILGTTLAMSGDIDGAELQFKKILTEHAQGHDYPLVEVYANLGSLYHNYRKDVQAALKYYQLALSAPKPGGIENEGYEFMVSNVHKDLCVIYIRERNFSLAKQFAIKRLKKVKDCPTARKVYDLCLQIEAGKGSA